MDLRKFMPTVKKQADKFYIIHYSSEGLFDDGTNGLSTRITSIVVMHYATRQIVSFSLHTEAESLAVPREKMELSYDDIERSLLKRFYDFARDRREEYWIHWNMRSVTFGFEHLEHRYRVLHGAEPPLIPVEVRINLNDALKVRYGDGYAKDPKLPNLMRMNSGMSPSYLSGAEEAEAFKQKQFIRMNNSTISKVMFLQYVVDQSIAGRLRTTVTGLLVAIDRALESRYARTTAFTGTLIGICTALYKFGTWAVG